MSMMTVDGIAVKTPSSWKWGLQDISKSNAGRTTDSVMHKNRIAQKRKLTLTWNGLSASETSAILKAFNPEYIEVSYPDAMSGATEPRSFYSGDKEANMYSWTVNKKLYKQLSFSIIER